MKYKSLIKMGRHTHHKICLYSNKKKKLSKQIIKSSRLTSTYKINRWGVVYTRKIIGVSIVGRDFKKINSNKIYVLILKNCVWFLGLHSKVIGILSYGPKALIWNIYWTQFSSSCKSRQLSDKNTRGTISTKWQLKLIIPQAWILNVSHIVKMSQIHHKSVK